MKWVGAAVVVAAVVAVPVTLRQEAPESAEPAKDDVERSVRVQHEYITIAPEVRTPVITAQRTTPGRTNDASEAPVRRTADSAFEKARRAILGDGRHRPQPFPSVR